MKINVDISKKVFNRSYLPLLNCDTRYLVMYGGSGSGKSYFIVERYVFKLLTRKKCNLLVVRNTGKSNRDSTYALFKQVIYKWQLSKLFTFNETDMRIRCINGNEVIFAGLDDVEKLKSVTFSKGELTDEWLEEASEIQEADFNQLDIRLRGKGTKKQIVISFNPIDINHWLKRRFIDQDSDNITVNHSTYKDNDFLDDDYKRLLESYKETDPYYYSVYCLGEWGVLGETIFDKVKVTERLKNLPKILDKGDFVYDREMKWKWVSNPMGHIKIYSQPLKNAQYVIGGDTASGVGSDYSIGQVLDADGNQVAVFRDRIDSDLYAKQMYCLGHYYNYALINIEVNYDLYPIKKLEEMGYLNQFMRERQDTYDKGVKKAFGFRTDAYTRPRILSQLIEIVREHTELFNDKETLEEMLTFIRNDKGRAEAQEGAHDDLVMAMAIAHETISQLRPQTRYEEPVDEYESLFSYGG